MDFLNELFGIYKQTNRIKFKEPKELSNQAAKFGDIVHIFIRFILFASIFYQNILIFKKNSFYS